MVAGRPARLLHLQPAPARRLGGLPGRGRRQRPHRFKAVTAANGFADWQLSYADNSGKLLDSPDINPAAFLASSATTQAHQLAGQLLIAHNIDDAVIPIPERPGGGRPAARRILTGGQRHALGGTFFQPTVMVGMQPGMQAAREETFGPLAPIFRFDTEAEAIALANATEFGLAAYFYTRDLGRAFRVAEALEYGMVGLNTGLISTAVAPFGGIKQSGFGREGGRQGLDEYLEAKYLCVGL
jgi:hypothetical protein